MVADIEMLARGFTESNVDRDAIRPALTPGVRSTSEHPLVCGLHQSRAAPSENVDAFPSEKESDLLGDFIDIVVRFDSGASEDANPKVVVGVIAKFEFEEIGSLSQGLEPFGQPSASRLSIFTEYSNRRSGDFRCVSQGRSQMNAFQCNGRILAWNGVVLNT